VHAHWGELGGGATRAPEGEDYVKGQACLVCKRNNLRPRTLDVMQAVREAANEQETLATVVHLLSSGQVRLSDGAIKAIQELSAITDVAA
jgi:hypothetical protein